MRLKFWKKIVKEKPKIIYVPEKHIRVILESFSIFNDEYYNYYLKFKDIIIEYPDFELNNVLHRVFRYKKFLLWFKIEDLIPELKNEEYYWALKTDNATEPYFKGTPKDG